MIKKLLKSIMEYTPYKITRRNYNKDFIAKEARKEIVNPIDHNKPEHINKIFQNKEKLIKFNSEERNRLYEYILSFIPSKGKKIIDFGCGPGYFLNTAIRLLPNNNYIGYDYSKVAVELALTLCPSAQIQVLDITNKIDEKCDIAICSQTLEHILYPEKALLNIINTVNPEGVLILTVPDGRKDQYHGHINFWSEESWKVWVEANVSNDLIVQFDRVSNSKGFDFITAVIWFGS